MHFRISHIRYIWESLLKNVMSNCVFEIKQDNMLGFASHFVMPFFLPELILSVLSDVKHQYKFWKKSPPCVNSGESSSKHKDSKLFVFFLFRNPVYCCLPVNVASVRTKIRMIVIPPPTPTPPLTPTQHNPAHLWDSFRGLSKLKWRYYLLHHPTLSHSAPPTL